MKIYNTLTQQKEDFKPLKPNELKMYLCGPTVYNLVHVGNMRGPIFFNFVRNYFEKVLNYKVSFVYNYTDVDDRIIQKSIEEKIPSHEVSEKYISEFEKDFKAVGLRKADVNPKVTDHIKEIVSLIEDIIKSGAGYVVGGEVFCSIEKIKDYGKLSHKNIEELIAGARVEIGEKKRNPLDFSLWKPAKPGEPFWEFKNLKGEKNYPEVANGRPGWHIECSAMAKKHLGETIDIHGGGIDLIFPHHENEIAQSESGNGKKFVNYWMHNNFINMGKDKMSKSLGNIFTARQFTQVYNGEILKFMILSSHYRSPADFSDNVIEHAISGLARVYSSMARAEKILLQANQLQLKPLVDNEKLKAFWQNIIKAAEDDFNTPEIMAEIFNLVRTFNANLKPGQKVTQELVNLAEGFKQAVFKIGSLMSLFENEPTSFLKELDDMLLKQKSLNREVIQNKVEQRMNAKSKKDFALADKLRDELLLMGIELRDSATGTEWEVKK